MAQPATALIGVVAIGLTTYTIVQTREQRWLHAFTSMNTLLITEESQRGWRMVYAAADSGETVTSSRALCRARLGEES